MDASKRTTMRVVSGATLAAAAASLFLSGTVVSPAKAEEAKVQCAGVNSCKGKSECASARNSCKGQNACKGDGWQSMTEQQCVEKGGKVKKG